MNKTFPSKIEGQDLMTLFERAVDFGEREEGEKIFELLEKSGKSNAQYLSSCAGDLKNYDKAIHYQIEHIKSVDDPWRKTFSVHHLAELYGLNGDYIKVWETANQWYMLLDEEDQTNQLETWFDISLGLFEKNKRKLALRSFRKGEKLLKRANPSLNLLEKVNFCCEKLNLPNKQKNYYRRLMEEKQKRIQEEFGD
ncbi:hypothetical protein [Hazenella coriacea]|uniref:Tetratricopeptide repeat protein n=1 Tax=Hazenella coriacea TaxID=1179467 RepID=A0A4R3L957_9BACL|nr:hypothetical protein [Hazenella coriacea]TCS95748.1 hypothetical protein EDD58_102328 [Hazenella coriacea]